jgi:hypothetical protein
MPLQSSWQAVALSGCCWPCCCRQGIGACHDDCCRDLRMMPLCHCRHGSGPGVNVHTDGAGSIRSTIQSHVYCISSCRPCAPGGVCTQAASWWQYSTLAARKNKSQGHKAGCGGSHLLQVAESAPGRWQGACQLGVVDVSAAVRFMLSARCK